LHADTDDLPALVGGFVQTRNTAKRVSAEDFANFFVSSSKVDSYPDRSAPLPLNCYKASWHARFRSPQSFRAPYWLGETANTQQGILVRTMKGDKSCPLTGHIYRLIEAPLNNPDAWEFVSNSRCLVSVRPKIQKA